MANSWSNESLKSKKKPRKQTTSNFKNLHLDHSWHANPYKNIDSWKSKWKSKDSSSMAKWNDSLLSKTFGELDLWSSFRLVKPTKLKKKKNHFPLLELKP